VVAFPFGLGSEVTWLSLVIALVLLVTAGLRMITVLLQSPDAGSRLGRSMASAGRRLRAIPRRLGTVLPRLRRRRTTRRAVTPSSNTASGSEAAQSGSIYRRAFVGRDDELKRAHEAFDRATQGQGSLLMVVGEPGIGKTALCEQLAAQVLEHGGHTLVGHSYEEGSLSLPYLPFIEAIRSYVLDGEPDQLKRELGSGAPEMARIISEIRDRLRIELRPAGDPEDDRWRLFNAVADFLRAAAETQPLLLILEDLHWADRGTLDLLLHVARNLRGSRLLVVATYRDVEVDRAHPLSSALIGLRQIGEVPRILLRGLTPDEVRRLVSAITGQDVRWSLAEGLHRQTEGNPLFIQEVLRYLVEEGLVVRQEGRWEGRWRTTGESPPETILPEGLRDVVGKRLSRLSPECNRLLSIAAVVGRDFRLDTLQAVAGVGDEAVLSGLEEALRIGVLEERARPGAIQYRFTHAFFRQTLYEEMMAPRRLRFHQEVARVLEQQFAGNLDEHAMELAEHFSQSTDSADLAKAVEYGEQAARRAVEVYAYTDAVRLLEQALQLQDLVDRDDQARQCDLLLALGAALRPAGESLRMVREVAPRALAFAEAVSDPTRAARACQSALDGIQAYAGSAAYGSDEWRLWAERADLYAEPATLGRIRADIALCADRMGAGDWSAMHELAVRALALARQLDEPDALFRAAAGLLRPTTARKHLTSQLDLSREFAGRSRDGVGTRALYAVLRQSQMIHLAVGDRGLVEQMWQELDQLASRTRDAELLIWPIEHEVRRLTLDGELDAAGAASAPIAARAEEIGTPARGRYATGLAFWPLLQLGRAEEASPVIFGFSTGDLGLEPLRMAYLGRRDEALAGLRPLLAEVTGPSGHDLPAAYLATYLETAVLTGDREAAALLAPRLEGLTAIGRLYFLENVARHQSAAAILLGDPTSARTYCASALDWAIQIRFRPEIALTRLQLAELLLDHYPAERGIALEHLEFAIAEFQAMKMQPALERALARKSAAAV
jgi:AAA ATPase domain